MDYVTDKLRVRIRGSRYASPPTTDQDTETIGCQHAGCASHHWRWSSAGYSDKFSVTPATTAWLSPASWRTKNARAVVFLCRQHAGTLKSLLSRGSERGWSPVPGDVAVIAADTLAASRPVIAQELRAKAEAERQYKEAVRARRPERIAQYHGEPGRYTGVTVRLDETADEYGLRYVRLDATPRFALTPNAARAIARQLTEAAEQAEAVSPRAE